uniref:Putative der and-72 secreted protein n=1 Tax=Rhipicephalus pulchellus TaxID=72859 RepID=L7LY03_RHIPC
MRVDIFIILLIFNAAARGGGPVKEPKVLKGYDDDNTEYPNDTSPCRRNRGTTSCFSTHPGWHFNRIYRACFFNTYSYCGDVGNHFNTCDECNKKCQVDVCADKVYPPDSWDLPFNKF